MVLYTNLIVQEYFGGGQAAGSRRKAAAAAAGLRSCGRHRVLFPGHVGVPKNGLCRGAAQRISAARVHARSIHVTISFWQADGIIGGDWLLGRGASINLICRFVRVGGGE